MTLSADIQDTSFLEDASCRDRAASGFESENGSFETTQAPQEIPAERKTVKSVGFSFDGGLEECRPESAEELLEVTVAIAKKESTCSGLNVQLHKKWSSTPRRSDDWLERSESISTKTTRGTVEDETLILDRFDDQFAVRGNKLNGDTAPSEYLLPVLLPFRRRPKRAQVLSPCAVPSLPELSSPSDSHRGGGELRRPSQRDTYSRLATMSQMAQTKPLPQTLKLPGRPFVVETWEPSVELPRPPHDVQARIRPKASGDAFAESEMESESSLPLSSASFVRKHLTHGDWAVAASEEFADNLLATWPGCWKQAALRRSAAQHWQTPRLARTQRLPKLNDAVDLTQAAERKALVLASRMVNWMASYQRQSVVVERISGGLRYLERQVANSALTKEKRWTVTLNRYVPKRSKPAQILDSKGRAILDRLHLHSCLADVAGIGEGGMDVRARLAQAGESIDRLYDTVIQSQVENFESYDVTKKDARSGLSFQIFYVILVAFNPPKVSQLLARELFDEFAGIPSETKATIILDRMNTMKLEAVKDKRDHHERCDFFVPQGLDL